MDKGEFERSPIDCGVVFIILFLQCSLDNIHSQNVPNIKTYAMTKSTRKIVILYQSRDRRLVLYFLLLAKSCEMISFSFQIS